MNELYNETIERNGHEYRYDPDYDCYYRVYTREELTWHQKYSWIVVVAVMTCVCAYVEFIVK